MSKQKKNKSTIFITLFFVIGICIAAAVLYSAAGRYSGPWEGRVLDIGTGEPVEGAVILASWERRTAAIIDYTHSVHKAVEIITDKNGYFYLPEYSPVNFLPGISEIRGPKISIFKPGYYYVENVISSVFVKGSTIKEAQRTTPIFTTKYSVSYKVSPNKIELPNLKTIADNPKDVRRIIKVNMPTRPSGISKENLIEFTRAINEERSFLGFEPL